MFINILYMYSDHLNSPESSSPASSFEYRPRSRSPGRKRCRDEDEEYSPRINKRFFLESDMNLRRMSFASDTRLYMNAQQDPPTMHQPLVVNTVPSVPSQNDVSLSISPQAFHHRPPGETIQTLPQTIPQNHIQQSPMPEVFAVPSNANALSDESPTLVRTSQLGHETKSEQASIALQDDFESMKKSW
jgi:hypothetical protein